MKKCLIIPDSFKGTMSSMEVCEIIKRNVLAFFPSCHAISIPVADGGEGTVECFVKALNGAKVEKQVIGPFGNVIDSFYGIIGDTAIIEMAAAAGFSSVAGQADPSLASTYGVGELILDAVNNGYKKIVLGLGGSCTNDAGAGAASALGAKFKDKDGKEIIPCGQNLGEVKNIDLSAIKEILSGVEITAICDIQNPMCGKNGAAYVFSPQKGADEEMVRHLDLQLVQFANTIEASLGTDVRNIKGAGAAGAMGAGAIAFLSANLKSGIDTILDMIGFEELLEGCDVVFTGEGKLDQQTLNGKTVAGIARRAQKKHVPVIVIAGSCESDMMELYKIGVSAIFSTCKSPIDDFEKIKDHSKEFLEFTIRNVLRSLQINVYRQENCDKDN